MKPQSINAVNKLPVDQKVQTYSRFIPQVLMDRFDIDPSFKDSEGFALLDLRCQPGASDVEIELRHTHTSPDPLLYAHLTDTIHDQIHVLLYVVNDPNSPRFDVDRMPDGRMTEFGTFLRNIPAEEAAMNAGLVPGQIRRGLRVLRHSIQAFEDFVESLAHELYFVEPLYYHNAVIFERYGFSYLRGRRLMDQIHAGFLPGGEFYKLLNGSTPFRQAGVDMSISGRSWAIHDGILGAPYSQVTMYKRVHKEAQVCTFPRAIW
jgi:hypothetical protein